MYKPPVRHILRATKVHGKTSYHRGAEKEAFRRAVAEVHQENVEDLKELADLEFDLGLVFDPQLGEDDWDDYRYESAYDFDSWEDCYG